MEDPSSPAPQNLQRRKAKISRRTGKLVYKHIYILDCKGAHTLFVSVGRGEGGKAGDVFLFYSARSGWWGSGHQ